MRLWERAALYYCAEEGYYYNAHQVQGWGAPLEYKTFWDFYKDWKDSDEELNMIFRWDWTRLTPSEYEEEYFEDVDPEKLNSDGNFSELKIFFMLQRKGCKKVVTITHMEDLDEELVKEFLKPRWDYLKKLWEGI